MARATYTEKPRKVHGEQFSPASTPWPPGVEDTGSGQYLYRYPSGVTMPIVATDWVVEDARNGLIEVLTDAIFNDRYGSGPSEVVEVTP